MAGIILVIFLWPKLCSRDPLRNIFFYSFKHDFTQPECFLPIFLPLKYVARSRVRIFSSPPILQEQAFFDIFSLPEQDHPPVHLWWHGAQGIPDVCPQLFSSIHIANFIGVLLFAVEKHFFKTTPQTFFRDHRFWSMGYMGLGRA